MAAALTETDTQTLSDRAIRDLVDEGGKLSRDIAALERKKARLDQIKTILRKLAGGTDREFAGAAFTASIENKADTVCRVVEELHVPRVVRICGTLENVVALFTLHPSKASEKNFELNTLKTLPKTAARKLLALLRVSSTPWVRFS